MRVLQSVCTAMIVVALGGLATGAEKEKKTQEKAKAEGTVHTVTASMDYPTNGGVGVQAEKKPGEFTIPKGSRGTKLKYSFFNPKSGNTLTKINGRNVYSVTEHRYMEELDGNPDFELPPGDYKFVVGGEPGATGTLTYTTIPSKGDDTTTKTRPPKDTTKGTSKDESKTGTESDPLHPGGEGKRKATLHLTVTITDTAGVATNSSGEATVTLAVSQGKMTVEFPKDMSGGIERWNGTLTRQGEAVTVNGTTEKNYSFLGGQSTTEWKGTFAGKLEGTDLKGTMAAHAELKLFGKVDGTADLKGEWSIKDFVR